MKKTILLLCISLLISCSADDKLYDKGDCERGESRREGSYGYQTNLKRDFGVALAKVLAESQESRVLLKEEALKQIDYDYDVIYQLVKSHKMTNGETFEDLLSKYIDKERLQLIDIESPTLTIFVPSLPNNSFSAELWDVDKDIPVVAIRTTETNDVPMIESSGEEWILEAQYIPTFPVVVIKDNERISSNVNKIKNSERNNLRSSSSVDLYFIDEVFDNTRTQVEERAGSNRNPNYPSTHTTPYITSVEVKKVIDSYDVFKNTDNWQRDYIYYNLTPTQTKGRINNNVMEYIVGFELVNPNGTDDATAVINKICDQTGDPMPNGKSFGANLWTDGELEFKVKCSVASTTGIGSEIVKYMRFKPSLLFEPVTAKSRGGRTTGRDYVPSKFTLKKHVFANLPLFEWNLETISPSIKISIEEVDSQETIRQSTSTTTEFAANFEYNLTKGETTKMGLKFGASMKKAMTVVYEYTTTKGNDELGDVIVNFGDNIIKSKECIDYGNNKTWLNFNDKYNSGWYRIYITPKEQV